MAGRRYNDHDSVTIGSVWWIWDSVYQEPREVEVVRSQRRDGEFLCWDTYETTGHRLFHQIYKKSQLFPTKAALCDHYIKKFQKFKEK